MSDLGSIGILGSTQDLRVRSAVQAGNAPAAVSVLVLGDRTVLGRGAGRDDVLGNPLPPSLQLRGVVDFGPILWRVQAGSNTFNIDCRYGPDDGVDTRPQVIAQANHAVGLHAEQVVTIAAGAHAWHTSPTIAVVARETGVLKVYLRTRNPRPDGANAVGIAGGSPAVYANWDNRVTG